MQRFDPPGFLDDLDDNHKELWSQQVSDWLDTARKGRPNRNDGPRTQFFNALETPPDADAAVAVISWNAFPRQVKSNALSDRHRWRAADGDRNLQDEYCEWSVSRAPGSNKITRVTFTCEGPEYWDFLAQVNPQLVLDLYRQHISPQVQREDLFPRGTYDPLNKFNNSTTNGAMHLIQGANTLRAEIELGAAATIRRAQGGRLITGSQELIACSRYGEPERNSDPHIGDQVNALARQGADITLNNPVGLYFEGFNPVGWKTPDGTDPRKFWSFVRGRDNHCVRAVFEVPAELGYTVGDITIAGRPIEFGAQIADFVTIKLEGLATRFGQHTEPPVEGCKGSVGIASVSPVSEDEESGRLTTGAPAPTTAIPELLQDGEAEFEVQALSPYPRLPNNLLKARSITGRLVAYASPDSTFAVTSKLLDAAKRTIVIGIYDFSAGYIQEEIKRALKRGVSVTLMLDTNSDEEEELLQQFARLGVNTAVSPSTSAGNPVAYFGYAHQKIIVVDGEIVMIQSGNWSDNSIPHNEGDGQVVGHFEPGNRDMGVAVYSRELAAFFADLVERDIRLSRGEPVDGASILAVSAPELPETGIFLEAAPSEQPEVLFPSFWKAASGPVKITPAITPENFHDVLLDLLHGARKRIWVEQQYIRGGQPAVEKLLDEMATRKKAHKDLDIRIIVSPKYLYGKQEAAFLKTMADHGFAFDDQFRFLSPRHFVHCHNKLVIVDDHVLIGSQNWSTTGLLTNREASLLIEDASIAAYFAEIMDADWHMSEPAAAITAIEPIAPPAEGKPFVISTKGDYADL